MARKVLTQEMLQRASGAVPGRPPAAPTPAAKSASAGLPYAVLDELRRLGWQEGDPIPGNLADRLADYRAQSEDGSDPPPNVFRSWLYEAPKVDPTAHMPDNVAAAYKEAMGDSGGFAQVVDDFGTPETKSSPEIAQIPTPAAQTDTDAAEAVAKERTSCPHCYFDLKQSVIEPEPFDKNIYIQARLGRIPFAKQYSLLGDRIGVRIRTLRRREHDLLFAYSTDETSDAKTATDLVVIQQRLERATFFSQILSYRSTKDEFDYPDGLDRISAPRASSTWSERLGLTGDHGLEPALYRKKLFEGIDAALTDDVFDVISAYRATGAVYTKFNKLTPRLEAMEQEPDFWPPIPS